jgi:CheY-like chemotaxis protein
MKKRILIVDADRALNKINEKVLCSAGIVNELHITTNGLDGINYIKNRIEKNYPLPDIIILDLNIPVLSGFEFIDEFQKIDFPGKSTIEIVIFTSSSNPKDKLKAQLRGIRNYLDKPYILRGLVDIISRIKTDRVNIYSNKKIIGKLSGIV